MRPFLISVFAPKLLKTTTSFSLQLSFSLLELSSFSSLLQGLFCGASLYIEVHHQIAA